MVTTQKRICLLPKRNHSLPKEISSLPQKIKSVLGFHEICFVLAKQDVFVSVSVALYAVLLLFVILQ